MTNEHKHHIHIDDKDAVEGILDVSKKGVVKNLRVITCERRPGVC